MEKLNKVVTIVSMIVVLQGCTYNCPYPSVTSAKPEVKPVAMLANFNPGMPSIGSAPREPSPPEELMAGMPGYPGESVAASKGGQGAMASSGRQTYEKSPFGAHFWAYLGASALIKCIPDCFK